MVDYGNGKVWYFDGGFRRMILQECYYFSIGKYESQREISFRNVMDIKF